MNKKFAVVLLAVTIFSGTIFSKVKDKRSRNKKISKVISGVRLFGGRPRGRQHQIGGGVQNTQVNVPPVGLVQPSQGLTHTVGQGGRLNFSFGSTSSAPDTNITTPHITDSPRSRPGMRLITGLLHRNERYTFSQQPMTNSMSQTPINSPMSSPTKTPSSSPGKSNTPKKWFHFLLSPDKNKSPKK